MREPVPFSTIRSMPFSTGTATATQLRDSRTLQAALDHFVEEVSSLDTAVLFDAAIVISDDGDRVWFEASGWDLADIGADEDEDVTPLGHEIGVWIGKGIGLALLACFAWFVVILLASVMWWMTELMWPG